MVKEGYKQTEIGVIPKDWEAVQLGKLAKVRMCKRIFAEQTTEEGDIPFYKIGTFGGKPDAYISRKLYEEYKSKYSYPKPGDILVSAAGTLGRTVVYDGKDAYFQDSNIVWLDVDKSILCNEYLKHYYNVIKWASSEGSTISRLYNGIIESTYIAYPKDLKEQSRIAEALSDIDELISSLEKLIAKKKAIKQGTMQQLLTGKTSLSNKSANWREERLGDIVHTSSGGTPSREVEEYYKGTIPWITTSELNDCHLYDSIEHITDEAVRNSSAKKFPRGTVLMAMYGATIGKLGILETESTTNQACCAMLCTPEVNNLYLFYYLLFNREEIVSLGSGAGQPNISQTIVKNLIIKIPDYDEQMTIGKLLSDMDMEIKELEARAWKQRQLKQGMMQQLLTGKIRLWGGYTHE